jgi:hypothetical protein
VTCISHCMCAVALVCCNGTEGGEKCWVNSSRIIQEGTNDVFDAFDLLRDEGLSGVNLHPGNPCTILEWCRLVHQK